MVLWFASHIAVIFLCSSTFACACVEHAAFDSLSDTSALKHDDECGWNEVSCSLSALQHRADRRREEQHLQSQKETLPQYPWADGSESQKSEGCNFQCLRSCIPGEDSSFHPELSYFACIENCGSGCQKEPLTSHSNNQQGIPGPSNGEKWEQWLLQMYSWKRKLQKSPELTATSDSLYSSSRVEESSATYVAVQTMVHDRKLYDPERRVWTADKYLEDLRKRFGGVDQVLVWAGYPNLGVDSRNQWEMLEAIPGGLRSLVDALKAAQETIIVQIPYKPWDISTNGLGKDGPENLVKEVLASGADGFNADTMNSDRDVKGNPEPMTRFFDAAAKAGLPDMIIEPELGLYQGTQLLNVTVQGWNYYLQSCPSCRWNLPFNPKVSTQKFLARRSMPHVCGRWASQRSEEILTAFINAVGYVAWENIWGIWNGFNERDGELLRRSAAILRHFHPLLSDPDVDWLPHYPLQSRSSNGKHVFASKFVGKDVQIWLLINTANEEASRSDWSLLVPSGGLHHEFFDVYQGQKLQPKLSSGCIIQSCASGGESSKSAAVELSTEVEPRGVAAILQVPTGELSDSDAAFLKAMKQIASKKLSTFSNWRGSVETQQIANASLQRIRSRETTDQSLNVSGMVLVSGSKSYKFRSRGLEIEGFLNWKGEMDNWNGVDVQYPWEPVPTKYHRPHVINIKSLWVDKYPVTNLDFRQFLQISGYAPLDSQNFLKHWNGKGCKSGSDCILPASISNQPVVFVSLDDARAFCVFKGSRLPHEWEWQYVAQGGDPTKRFPWGSDWKGELMPPPQADASAFSMSDVGQYPGGESATGIQDLVGLIWHWTDEYMDKHTRSAVLKGGSAFQPQNSHQPRYQPWYFPGHDGNWTNGGFVKALFSDEPKNYASLYNLTAHGKYLLMAPSYDRAGTIGFRCVADA
eukprot:TRINITY_DN29692_c0_g1_i1.p1 TRINITY_DN29692_c0_g1~~TRINITY_DN29692_c0_g1_i1.p1  ORF type:complete len:921 (-),score=129.81 TRINITY_DN29692_c0_g1_i1:539-3301(-)